MKGRGQLTDRVQKLAKKLLGYEISITELRLMPYIQYEMMNNQKLEIRKLNGDDRKVLKKWREKGFMEGGVSGLAITKKFWDIINEVMWISYVDYGQED